MNRFAAAAVVAVVVAAAPAVADEVKLVTGETLTGVVVSRDASGVVLDHPVLGRVTIPNEKIAPPPPAPPAWKFRLELGASGTRGNSDQSDLYGAISAVNDTDTGTFKGTGGWATSETDGVKTKNQQWVEGIYDFKIPGSRWSPFVSGRMDWDDFKEWDHRASVFAGIGYLLVDEKDLTARLRAGLGATREWGSSDEDREEWRMEGLLGGEFSWKVNSTNTVEGRSTWYPDLEDGGEYRLVSSLSWAVRLAEDSSLALKLGLEHEYDSHNEPPVRKNDWRYFAAIVWDF